MKKIWVYLLGVLTGIVVTFVTVMIIGTIIEVKKDLATKTNTGMSFFETPGDIIEPTSVKVFQALDNGSALAECKGDGKYMYTGPNVLLYNEEETPYYDEQIIQAPSGKCFKQMGIYRYHAKDERDRTVPIVMLMEK